MTRYAHRRHTRRHLLPLLLVPVALLVASSCGTGDAATARAEDRPPATVPVSPMPSTSVTLPAPATAAPATVPASTLPPTTVPPLTLPPTTLPPTTSSTTTTTTTTTTLPPNVELIDPSATPFEAVGTRDGAATAAIQQRLLDLGFWHSGVDGEYGHTTKQAVMAFQKYLGLEASGAVDEATAAFLQFVTEQPHGTANTGDLIEVDKVKQLLFVVRDGKTVWVFNTSTGNGLPYEEPDKNSPGEIQRGVSITPDGLWKVNRERAEGWWEGDLGQIYRPKYFRGGVAVHGSNSIPNYPASHGCVRVSVAAMDFIWEQDLMPMRSVVWVHGG